MGNKKKDIATFEDLLVWQVSRDLRKRIASLCKELPKEETYKLKDQMIRASRSVTANIAEGDMVVFIIRRTSNIAGKPEVHFMS